MKQIVQLILVLFLLCGCANVKDRREEQEQLERLQSQVENQSLTVSESLPFNYEFTMVQEDSIEYMLTISDFDIAMYDVKILAVPLDENGEASSLGFDDDQTYQVIPFQEAIEKGYYSTISLTGSLTSSQEVLGIVIQWKDVSGVDTYQRYWEIDCSLYMEQ